jgi:preprotein translocase subunit SecD
VTLHKTWWRFFLGTLVILLAGWVALPNSFTLPVGKLLARFPAVAVPANIPNSFTVTKQTIDLRRLGIPLRSDLPLKQGLDIQGGTQITLEADMSNIPAEQRQEALQSALEVLRRRVDLFGINEPQLRSVIYNEHYRIMVELPGLDQPEAALPLIGQTAQLQFREEGEQPIEATASALTYMQSFQPTELTGELLERAQVQFDPQTNQPVVSLQFNSRGADLFGRLTEKNVGKPLGIFLDNQPVTLPVVNEPIYGGQAVIQGEFTLEQAQTLAAQLNAGALPVSISILEQTTIGPTLGQSSLSASVRAGLIGLMLVAIFMILLYGIQGIFAVVGLVAYGVITVALYKLIPITVTLPGIAGLLLSIGMAVDSNILSFERIKDELRQGKSAQVALKEGYTRSWDTIKDANLATLAITFILFNPLNWGFLNSSGPIRGFAVTLALGIFISMFTGVWYSRWLLQLFWKPKNSESKVRKGKS